MRGTLYPLNQHSQNRAAPLIRLSLFGIGTGRVRIDARRWERMPSEELRWNVRSKNHQDYICPQAIQPQKTLEGKEGSIWSGRLGKSRLLAAK